MRPERFPASFSQGPHPTIAKLEAEIVYRVKMHCMIAYGRYSFTHFFACTEMEIVASADPLTHPHPHILKYISEIVTVQ